MTSLRRRMIEDMQIRNLAVNTQEVYIQQVSLFARHFQRSPERLGPEQIRAYQVYLTNEKKLATGSIIVAISALRFLYRVTLKKDWSFDDIIPAPKVPKKLPIILSPEEVLQFLDCVESRKHLAILTTCYAAGLRISEAVGLTPPAIDSKRMVIRVEQGKGQKDRYVILSPKLLEILRSWWRVEKPKDWLFPGDIPGRHITRFADVDVERRFWWPRNKKILPGRLSRQLGTCRQRKISLPVFMLSPRCGFVLASSVLGTPKAESQRVDVHVAPSNDCRELQNQINKLNMDLEAVKKNLDSLKNAQFRHPAGKATQPLKKSDHQ